MQDQATTSTPDLARLNLQLAANAARVSQYVETLTSRVDRLVEATMTEDWQEVRRLSDHLSQSSNSYGYEAIGERARRVCDAMDQPGDAEANVLEIKRSVLRLIGACGRARQPNRTPRT
jgi:tRNA A58 N-methylase Trm61